MPYIRAKDRESGMNPATPGELNYAITCLCDAYLCGFGMSYQTLNDVVGALECAKLEIYRRVVAPHEDLKCAANGDVYDCLKS